VIAYIEREALGDLRDPGIARSAIKRAEEAALLELPGDRMLAAASTYQQHVQWGKAPLERGCLPSTLGQQAKWNLDVDSRP
jgi:hypothetical protein